MLENDLDIFNLIKLAKKAKKRDGESVQITILSDCASQQISQALTGLFFYHDIKINVYEPPIDTIDSEIRDSSSELYNSSLVFIFYSTLNLRDKYYSNLSKANNFLEQMRGRIENNLEILQREFKGIILQSNFSTVYERPFGNLEYRNEFSLSSIIQNLNSHIYEIIRAADGIYLSNIYRAANYVGLQKWYDDRLWTFSKTPCSLDSIVHIVKDIFSIYRASKGSIVKCLILDLDNTLWGGVIGDDGIDGIGLGHLDEGESFVRFQQYIKELKNRGLILAVCSKNTQEVALSVFRDHPDMVLKEDDIAIFVANWNNKAENIKYIQKVLNIGFDSMVFIDDSHFERNLVRKYIPDLIVPEMPEEPSEYIKYLSELNLFETTTWSTEDQNRAEMYKVQALRSELEIKIDNKDDYLKSLQMSAQVQRFDKQHLPRISQLIQRSNQFNLVTSRFSLKKCEDFMKDKTYFPFYIKLEDRFGEYGLISSVISRQDGDTLDILEWVMSCRVLKRDVENLALNLLVRESKLRKVKRLKGTYLETPKNALVKDFYSNLGFKQVEKLENGSTWELDISSYKEKNHFIKQREEVKENE